MPREEYVCLSCGVGGTATNPASAVHCGRPMVPMAIGAPMSGALVGNRDGRRYIERLRQARQKAGMTC